MDVLALLDRLSRTTSELRESKGQSRKLEVDMEWKLTKMATASVTADDRELRRIVNLPIEPNLRLGDHDFESFCYDHIEAGFFDKGFRLFEPQASGWKAYIDHGCFFGIIGVGWGKTLLSLAIANHAYQFGGIKKSILCVPSQVYEQLTQRDIAWCRRRINLSVPFHLLGKKQKHQRKGLTESEYSGCYILPYSLLSTQDTEDMLVAIKPGLVILDEAHNLKNRKAARTRRVFDYLDVMSECHLVAMSGTITAKSISDYHHIMRRCLGENCPMPLDVRFAQQWGIIIDSGSYPTDRQAVELFPLVQWAAKNFPEEKFKANVQGFRKAYKLRLGTAPGVVATSDSEIGSSLVLHNKKVEEHESVDGFFELNLLIKMVEDQFLTPTGDEIEHAIHAFKWLYELSAGFYNELYWPEPERLAQQKELPLGQAEELLEAAKAHHECQQEYHRVLRNWLSDNAKPNLDTPFLVGGSMQRHGSAMVGEELYEAWSAMKAMEVDHMPTRFRRAIRICDYKVRMAVDWAKEHPGRGGIIWYYNQEMGVWVSEELKKADVDFLHCPAGPQGNKNVTNLENVDKILVAGLDAHGTGKNLQHFSRMFYLQWPRRAVTAEQSLGRIHRNGQMADEVEARLCNTLLFDHLVYAACIQDSLYIHETTGVRQKLIYATHDPLPFVYSPEFLRENGMENKQLNSDLRSALQEKFGDFQAA